MFRGRSISKSFHSMHIYALKLARPRIARCAVCDDLWNSGITRTELGHFLLAPGAIARSPWRLQRWLVHHVGSADRARGAPMSRGSRVGYGREIGPRCRGPIIAR